MMNKKTCHYCGSDQWEERRYAYLYKHRDQYLIVPDLPHEVCTNCYSTYYPAAVLLAVERMFLAIQEGTAAPDRYIEVPIADYATVLAHDREPAHEQLVAA
jgi:YgiT-type zinc finger domain-containing protein